VAVTPPAKPPRSPGSGCDGGASFETPVSQAPQDDVLS
jgi:hypothetical protein